MRQLTTFVELSGLYVAFAALPQGPTIKQKMTAVAFPTLVFVCDDDDVTDTAAVLSNGSPSFSAKLM